MAPSRSENVGFCMARVYNKPTLLIGECGLDLNCETSYNRSALNNMAAQYYAVRVYK